MFKWIDSTKVISTQKANSRCIRIITSLVEVSRLTYITIPFFLHSWLVIGFLTRVTRRVPPVEQELVSFPENLSSSLVFSWLHVAQSLVFCVVFCRLLLVFLSFFFWPLYCLSFFFWPLYCLSFFDLGPLITPLLSSNFSRTRVQPETIEHTETCVESEEKPRGYRQASLKVISLQSLYLCPLISIFI